MDRTCSVRKFHAHDARTMPNENQNHNYNQTQHTYRTAITTVHSSSLMIHRYPISTENNEKSSITIPIIVHLSVAVFALWDLSISMHLNAGKKRNPKWYVRASQRNDDFFRLKQKRHCNLQKKQKNPANRAVHFESLLMALGTPKGKKQNQKK